MSVIRAYLMVCETCEFVTKDSKLMDNHNCDTNLNSGNCEDYPCCGHEMGDCNGLKYGSDEAIKERAYAAILDNDDMYCGYDEEVNECDDEDCYVTGMCSC